jgi:dihydroorotase-like cyclic amidohydrolase
MRQCSRPLTLIWRSSNNVQDDDLTYGGVLNGGAAKRLGMKEMPWVSETAQVARDVILAEATAFTTMFVTRHPSTQLT